MDIKNNPGCEAMQERLKKLPCPQIALSHNMRSESEVRIELQSALEVRGKFLNKKYWDGYIWALEWMIKKGDSIC